MDSISFQVSAKTARLIGRENISDVDGAIVELIKNGYDADADCVFVKYINPYNKIPEEITLEEIKLYFLSHEVSIDKYYKLKKGRYFLKENLSDDLKEELKSIILSFSKIIVLDNGCGMTQEILKNSWMNIGTDDKEINIYSTKKHRIKTGAKGIGRFALDKLSIFTEVITKNQKDSVSRWSINWSQFDDAKLLNQVQANLETVNSDFETIIRSLIGKDFIKLEKYDWTSGTAIILSPIREFWNQKLYKKVNRNLQNVNPLGNADQFDIFVINSADSSLNYEAKNQGIKRDTYDYKIEAYYDGHDKITLSLDRNEIDINKKEVSVKYSETDIETYSLNEFWGSSVFNKKNYRRDDFNGEVKLDYSLNELLPKLKEDVLNEYYKIGSFHMTIYYLKNTTSNVEIIRDYKVKERKKLLDYFSGIKIYRDNFKVRPYGDEGSFYDWIDLGKRMQSSPAAASHETGSWRVAPYQVVGSVSISRFTNSRLEDTANREGMHLNQEYYAFINLIKKIFDKFEYDRQYPLREYASWLREKKKTHTDKAQEVYEYLMKENSYKNKNQETNDSFLDQNTLDTNYSKEDYKEALYIIGKQKQAEMSTNQLLMILSSAGVMAQTFSHEISRVASNLGSRGQHIRESVNRILNYKPYDGDEDFNPYEIIDELNSTDILLADWVNLIMASVQKENFFVEEIELGSFLLHTNERWLQLLSKKYIDFQVDCKDEATIKLPVVDLHLILNNFLLNSAYFLEECDGNRLINISVYKKNNYLFLDMKNNGPELDERYKQTPDEVLNIGVSSKNNGTGLGLWVAREAVQRNYGSLHVIPIVGGFMLQASWRI